MANKDFHKEYSAAVIPSNDDEQVKSVPRIAEVRSFAEQTHRDDLDAHLGGEEDEDGMVEALKDAAA